MTKVFPYSWVIMGVCAVVPFGLAIGQSGPWNGKQCAIVLTYDDALEVHLDNVAPVLDEHGLKGTFYTSTWDMLGRLDDWRKLAESGHELGNHTIYHPCIGSGEGREWVQPDKDLDAYSVNMIVREIKMANAFLYSLDGQSERTFAYTCGDTAVNGQSFVRMIRDDFLSARGVHYKLEKPAEVQMMNVKTFAVVGHSAADLIAEVEKAEREGALITFLFHGVGGGHSMNTDNGEHTRFIEYLAGRQDDIWVDTMVEVSRFLIALRQD